MIVPLEERLNDIKDCIGFRIFFLGEQECDVEVSEVKQIDFDNVKRRLKNGKSVFMTTIFGGNWCHEYWQGNRNWNWTNGKRDCLPDGQEKDKSKAKISTIATFLWKKLFTRWTNLFRPNLKSPNWW